MRRLGLWLEVEAAERPLRPLVLVAEPADEHGARGGRRAGNDGPPPLVRLDVVRNRRKLRLVDGARVVTVVAPEELHRVGRARRGHDARDGDKAFEATQCQRRRPRLRLAFRNEGVDVAGRGLEAQLAGERLLELSPVDRTVAVDVEREEERFEVALGGGRAILCRRWGRTLGELDRWYGLRTIDRLRNISGRRHDKPPSCCWGEAYTVALPLATQSRTPASGRVDDTAQKPGRKQYDPLAERRIGVQLGGLGTADAQGGWTRAHSCVSQRREEAGQGRKHCEHRHGLPRCASRRIWRARVRRPAVASLHSQASDSRSPSARLQTKTEAAPERRPALGRL